VHQRPGDSSGNELAAATTPPALHLLIGSRSQPPLALSRLHMQDQLLEVYDPELRFNPSEARAYFAGASGLDPQAIPRLIALTQGWVAGMKMAALSPDASTAMGFGAGSRSISRYLDEVIFRAAAARSIRLPAAYLRA
jgi:LuxR family maltose regulon positive regulatory protein